MQPFTKTFFLPFAIRSTLTLAFCDLQPTIFIKIQFQMEFDEVIMT